MADVETERGVMNFVLLPRKYPIKLFAAISMIRSPACPGLACQPAGVPGPRVRDRAKRRPPFTLPPDSTQHQNAEWAFARYHFMIEQRIAAASGVFEAVGGGLSESGPAIHHGRAAPYAVGMRRGVEQVVDADSDELLV